MRRIRLLLVLLVVAAVPACRGGTSGGDQSASTDTLTRRQKDSLISTMPLPGAGGVGRALDAADAASARALAHDSLLDRQP